MKKNLFRYYHWNMFNFIHDLYLLGAQKETIIPRGEI